MKVEDSLTCVSINYKNSDVDFRKRFAFSEDIQRNFLSEAVKNCAAAQCVLLCTCNRTEIYFLGDLNKVVSLLADFGGISAEELLPKLMIFSDSGALSHLFRVACGIESMVIGEDEILGQTKAAYALAGECGTVSSELNMIFQSAVTSAKKIKTRTALSRTSVSTATLAANEAAKQGSNVKVLLMGASGKIGSVVLKDLLSHKNVSVTVTVRNHNADLQISAISPKIRTVNYSERYEYMDESDCIISATSSPHYTVTAQALRENTKTEKERLFIDLAVPPDIDEEIGKLSGVRLIGIDHFERLARENNSLKLDSVEAAKKIIEEDIDELKKNLSFHEFLKECGSVKAAVAGRSAEEIIYRLKADLNSEQLSAVLKILKTIGGDS